MDHTVHLSDLNDCMARLLNLHSRASCKGNRSTGGYSSEFHLNEVLDEVTIHLNEVMRYDFLWRYCTHFDLSAAMASSLT